MQWQAAAPGNQASVCTQPPYPSADPLAAYLPSQDPTIKVADVSQQRYLEQCQQPADLVNHLQPQQYYYATTASTTVNPYQQAAAPNCDEYTQVYQEYATTTTPTELPQQIIHYLQPSDQQACYESTQSEIYIKQMCTKKKSPQRVVNKMQHNEIERRRRSRIKSCCDTLRILVPGLSAKTDKANILEQTVRYIQHMNECPAMIRCNCYSDAEDENTNG